MPNYDQTHGVGMHQMSENIAFTSNIIYKGEVKFVYSDETYKILTLSFKPRKIKKVISNAIKQGKLKNDVIAIEINGDRFNFTL